MTKERLEQIKIRAKQGAHYAEWLHVPELIAEIETLQKQLEELSDKCNTVLNLLNEEGDQNSPS